MKKLFTLIAISFFFFSPLVSEASHFRYGHITWTRTPGTRTVTFTVTTAWRYDFTETINLDFGDGTTSGSAVGTEILYVPNDYRVYQTQITHTYATDGPYTASFYSCCRISTLQNGADDNFWVSSVVCLSNNNLGSPTYTSPVIIEMNSGGNNQFQLVTSEPDGTPITYSTSAIQGLSYLPTIGSNVASVSSAGVISWNTTGSSIGQLYQMKVVMSDGCAKSEIDFIIKIVACPLSSTLTGTQTISQGQNANLSLTFNGTSPPWTYRLSGTSTDVTTSTSPTTITVTPSATTTYSITSLSSNCGLGTPSGSAIITVTNPISLVSCLPLNGNANDQIGSNNGFIYVNGGSNSYTTNRNGTSTSALSISNGSYIEMPTTNLLNNYFTHSMWISPLSLPISGNNSYLVSIGGIANSQDIYIENASGTYNWVFKSSVNTGIVEIRYPANLVVGQWYHVVAEKNSSTFQLYVNGALVQSASATGLTALYSASSIGRLGTQSSGVANLFNGIIDDVRLFTGGLNALQINALFNSTLDCPSIIGIPLISLTSISNSSLCRNQLTNVNFQQSGVISGSTYTVQLSDANGSFTSPINIGTGTVSPIQVSIPSTVTASGTGFLVRIINGATTSTNILPLTILPTTTAIITGTTTILEGQAANLSISLTGTAPWTYSISNGQSSTSYTSSAATATQSVSPLSTTIYTLANVSDNGCGTGTVSGSAVITVNPALQLLACYPFNGDAQDSKGTHGGTVNGATLTTDRFGNANSAYSFDGNSYIQLANPDDFKNNTFTYSAWVNANDLPGLEVARTILSIGNDGADQHFRLFNSSVTSGPAWNFNSYIGNGVSTPLLLSYTSVVANTWIHVVVTRSLTGRKVYVNGILSVSDVGLSSPYYATPTLATIGSRYNGIQKFYGKIDDVKIYKGTLNDAQVTAIYLAEQQCPTVETGGLITATSLSTNGSCPSGSLSVNVVTNNIVASSGSPLIVQLSNSSGLFTSPVQIGSGTSSTISCSIPTNTPAGNYKIRVVFGTSPNQVISVNNLPLIIKQAVTATISGTSTIVSGGSAPLTLNFTGNGPWTYRLSGTSTDISTSITPTIINVSPASTTTYTLLLVSNACGTGTTSGSALITVSVLPQLLACYKFDGNAQDSKGNHHGIVNGATLTTDRFGKVNAAYNFDGGSNYIQLNNSTDFGITEFTWSAWVNASVLATLNVPKTILSIGNSAGDQHINMYYWDISGQSGWNYGSYTSPTTAALPYLISYNFVSTNNWVHIAVVRTLTERKMYINGQLAVGNTAAPAFYNTPILAIIGSRYNGIQTFSGKIDDVKIYNGALTDDDVLLLYNEEQGECSSPCSGMIFSVNSGNWNSPSTWSCSRIPDLTDKVLIKAGHTVTISANDAKARKLVNNGQVSLANSTSKLTFGAAPTQTITYISQPGPINGKDAEVSSYNPTLTNPDANFTNIFAWTISGTSNIKRVYMGFDLASIPTNAVVDSAFLSLYFSQAFLASSQGSFYTGHIGDNAFFINRVTGNWAESGISWNTQPSFTNTNQVSIPAFSNYRQDYQKMNVKNLVSDMVANPSNSFGFMLGHQVESPYKITIFTTSEETDASIRPKLQIYYHLP
jgi:hypothetical protein